MTYQEKRSIVTLISNILIFGCYSYYVFVLNHDESLSQINEPSFWGKFILISIPVSIVAHIIINILFAIAIKIADNEDIPSFSDELDKLIELKSQRISYIIFIFGFLLAMVTQVMHMELYMLFLTLISTGFVASIVDDAAKLYFYRKGF